MTSRARRRFIARAGALAAGGWAALLQRAAAIGPARGGTGTLRDVQHIVILMQENRSFDHYFGGLNGVRGFADPFPLPLSGGRTVWLQPRDPAQPAPPGASPHLLPWRLDTQADFRLMRAEGTPHRWPDAQAAWDHGRMADWPAAKRNHAMAHFDRADLPLHAALADAFTLCDAYHCSFMGGTHPNRYYLNTGTIDPGGRGGGPALYNDFEDFGPAEGPGSQAGYRWTSYAERLQDAGVSWHLYQDLDDNFGDNSLAGLRRFRDAFHGRSQGDRALAERAAGSGGLARLKADVLADRLPQVSWIVGTAEGSEHPWKSSPAQGAAYVAQALDALIANPEVWRRTVLFINYDENDGFFDHVPPPAPPSIRAASGGRFEYAGASQVDTTGEYHLRLAAGHDGPGEAALLGRPYGLGPRVPMFVISPWSRGGHVCSEVFDHTSTLRFIEARFGVPEPNISDWRRAVCGDLTRAFDFGARGGRTLPRPALPATQALAEQARALPGTTLPTPPTQPRVPVQAAGARPARALPYDLRAHGQALAGRVRLHLRQLGPAAVVVHVMQPRRPGELPRRYTLRPGGDLHDDFAADADGRYDLWVTGPNGWHQRLQGLATTYAPMARLEPAAGASVLRLSLSHGAARARRLVLEPLAYRADAPRELMLAPQGSRTLELPMADGHRWYDWRLTLPDEPEFAWRWAGHLENGRAGWTDPAMHGPAVLACLGPPDRRPPGRV